jgi:hypothetical protein
MSERDEELTQAMERIGCSMRRTIRSHLVIDSELTPLPSPDDPLYELIRAQHGIADLLRRQRSGVIES